MAFKVAFKTAILLQICVIIISAYKYGILLRDEEVFSPCEDTEFQYVTDIADLSAVQFEQLENGSVYAHGVVVEKVDPGTKDNPLKVRVYKKKRDNWVHTVYNLDRPDVCKSLFDKVEYWYTYVKNMPAKEQVCPFYKGKRFPVDSLADMTLNLPDPSFAGQYKVEILSSITERQQVFCANIYVEVYRA